MWKTGRFLQVAARTERCVFHIQAAIRKSRGSFPRLFPGQPRGPVDKSSAVLLEEEKFSPFCTKVRTLSLWPGGLLLAGQPTALPGASGIPGG